jgi:hypothetical protein
MKKLHAVLIAAALAALFAGLVILGGCTGSAISGQRYRGRHQAEACRIADNRAVDDGQGVAWGSAQTEPHRPAGSLHAPVTRGGQSNRPSAGQCKPMGRFAPQRAPLLGKQYDLPEHELPRVPDHGCDRPRDQVMKPYDVRKEPQQHFVQAHPGQTDSNENDEL